MKQILATFLACSLNLNLKDSQLEVYLFLRYRVSNFERLDFQ